MSDEQQAAEQVRRGWRVFGLPVIPLRFVPLVGAVLTVLFAHPAAVTPNAADWTLALVSAVLTICGGRWPLIVVAGQSGLLVASAFTGQVGLVVVQVLAAFAIVEVVMRRYDRWSVLGVLLVAGATATTAVRVTGAVPQTVLWTVLVVGAASGFGVYLWSLRLWMARYQEMFLEAERLRAARTREVRAGERTAIARELHDLLAHHVASIVLRVGVARHVVTDAEPALAEVLDDVHETGTAALAQLRELVGVLRDPTAVQVDPSAPLLDPADLRAALDGVSERISRAGLPVRADVDERIVELDGVRRLTVLRVAQEALTNALTKETESSPTSNQPEAKLRFASSVTFGRIGIYRHSKHATGATSATLTVRLIEGSVVIEIRDDGNGAVSTTDQSQGHGLIGLAERVRLVGGTFTVSRLPPERPDDHTSAGGGWLVRAVLPLPAETVPQSSRSGNG